ncbi:ORF6N domain-containing protein [Pedobacter nyackensis]|uniref:ORF6N domain-containing protein n=1 Tax=Pedobacter nyackensis TaxID=475255 RepID=UPI00292DEF41|nr:ORF6N domain-containing protein [Pedobacter nyackensis]
MTDKKDIITIPDEVVMNQIYYIREQKVMLDSDLAALYEVDTKQLKRQVKRNIDRFPDDFMFELTPEEYKFSRSQNGTLKQGGNIKYAPMVLLNKVFLCFQVF